MLKNRKIGLIFTTITVILLLFTTLLFMKNDIEIEGWKDFNRNIKQEYGFVESLAIHSHTPIKTSISFSLNRECRIEDLLPLFEKTRNYVISEAVFTDLRELHNSRFEGAFDEIIFEYSFFDDSSDYYSQFQFSSRVYDDTQLGTWKAHWNNDYLFDYSDGKIIEYDAA